MNMQLVSRRHDLHVKGFLEVNDKTFYTFNFQRNVLVTVSWKDGSHNGLKH